jgi:hypothetical protein
MRWLNSIAKWCVCVGGFMVASRQHCKLRCCKRAWVQTPFNLKSYNGRRDWCLTGIMAAGLSLAFGAPPPATFQTRLVACHTLRRVRLHVIKRVDIWWHIAAYFFYFRTPYNGNAVRSVSVAATSQHPTWTSLNPQSLR